MLLGRSVRWKWSVDQTSSYQMMYSSSWRIATSKEGQAPEPKWGCFLQHPNSLINFCRLVILLLHLWGFEVKTKIWGANSVTCECDFTKWNEPDWIEMKWSNLIYWKFCCPDLDFNSSKILHLIILIKSIS